MRDPGRCRAANVFITDASPMVCHLMASALQRSRYNLNVIGYSTDSDGTLSAFAAPETQVDVVVIGAHLKEGSLAGLNLARKLRASHPNTHVVALLDSSERSTVIEAFRSGCRGIFSREQDFEMLCKCIRRVQEGQVWATGREMKLALDALAEAATSSAPANVPESHIGRVALTNRERGVIRLVAEGLSNRDISRQLNLSEHTVRNYLFRIFNKVGTSNRIELALYAVHHRQTEQNHTNGPTIGIEPSQPGP